MSHATIREIVYDTCLSIWKSFGAQHMPIPSTEHLESIANDFFNKWDFPNCVGCIGEKHIRIKCLKYFPIVVQCVADANYKFSTIDVGAYGKQSDGGMFSSSNICNRLETDNFNMPEDKLLPNSDILVPYVLLGDETYPITPYLMGPYSGQNLTNEERNYNFRLSRARRSIECAFGLLDANWKCLKNELLVHPKRVDTIVKCVCLLHNIVIDKEGCNVPGQDIATNNERNTNVST